GEGVQVLSLGQNRPNPFGTTTDIEVSVPENVQSAFVYVYDLQGKEVQQVDITGRGKQTVQLNAAELTDGMYLYSLIADGQVVETRRMIVKK
ncbi:MAG: T9SS type A sorting domain-containing protein, partial [Bacteroidales bacterium]|nr:T9SS type A sorting domain-containing protein [Bacteroidales bacterium]